MTMYGTDKRHHTLTVLVENKAGVLARVAGLFSRRGYNIFSLAVAPSDDERFSRITIVVDVESAPLDQIMKQLDKLIPVVSITELDPAMARERELLMATLDGIESGQLEARPQPGEGVSLAPKITAEDARVRWDQPATAVDRQIRACTPSPGAWTTLGEARVKLGPIDPAPEDAASAGTLAPGQVAILRSGVLVGTATTPVRLGDVQPPGKRRMRAADWARGLRQDAAVLS